MRQLVMPDLMVMDFKGYSWSFTVNAFKAYNNIAPTALEALEASVSRFDGLLPDFYVPVWFTYKIGSNGDTMTVCGIWNPNTQTIYTTPLREPYGVKQYTLKELNEQGYKYVGWSKDLNGLKVVS